MSTIRLTFWHLLLLALCLVAGTPENVFAANPSVDHIRITVYYTVTAVPDISWWSVLFVGSIIPFAFRLPRKFRNAPRT